MYLFIISYFLVAAHCVCPSKRTLYNSQQVKIENCSFYKFITNNGDSGGVISIGGLRSQLLAKSCDFIECKCTTSSTSSFLANGGGIFTRQTITVILHCRFQKCQATEGGGLRTTYNKNTTCEFCIFDECTSPTGSAAVSVNYQDDGTAARFDSCLFLNCYHTNVADKTPRANTLNMDYEGFTFIVNATISNCTFANLKEIAIRSEVNYMNISDVIFSNINNSMESFGACMYCEQSSVYEGEYNLYNIRVQDIDTRDYAMNIPSAELNLVKSVFKRIKSIDGDNKIFGFDIAVFALNKFVNIENCTFMDCKSERGCLYIESQIYMDPEDSPTVRLSDCLFVNNVLTKNLAGFGASLHLKKNLKGNIGFYGCIFIFHRTNEASSVVIDGKGFEASFENTKFNTTFSENFTGPLHLQSNVVVHFLPTVCANDVDIGFNVSNGSNVADIKNNFDQCNFDLIAPPDDTVIIPSLIPVPTSTPAISTPAESSTPSISSYIPSPTESSTPSISSYIPSPTESSSKTYVPTPSATSIMPTISKSRIRPTSIITPQKSTTIPFNPSPRNPTSKSTLASRTASIIHIPSITEDAGKAGSKSGVSPATFAGIVIGCIVVVAVCIIIVFVIRYYKNRKYKADVNSDVYNADHSTSYGENMSSTYSNAEMQEVFDDEIANY